MRFFPMAIEYVDLLTPPHFEPSGEVKPAAEAINDGNWLGVMNLWIVRPGPALIYQERPNFGWAPGKFDVSIVLENLVWMAFVRPKKNLDGLFNPKTSRSSGGGLV
jgi:hypothetical protein